MHNKCSVLLLEVLQRASGNPEQAWVQGCTQPAGVTSGITMIVSPFP